MVGKSAPVVSVTSRVPVALYVCTQKRSARPFRYACVPFIRIMLELCIMLDIRLSSCW